MGTGCGDQKDQKQQSGPTSPGESHCESDPSATYYKSYLDDDRVLTISPGEEIKIIPDLAKNPQGELEFKIDLLEEPAEGKETIKKNPLPDGLEINSDTGEITGKIQSPLNEKYRVWYEIKGPNCTIGSYIDFLTEE